jgi:hypothetical protein
VADYSIADLTRAASSAGFSGASLVTAVAVSLAENGGRSLRAVGVNTDQWHSRDRGPWQINDHWHPDVSDSCAFDLNCSAQAAFKISNQGRSWTPWATFNNGAYKQHLGDAAANSSSTASPDSVGIPGLPSLPDLRGVGTAIQGATALALNTFQVAFGGFLIVGGLLVVGFIVMRKNA